MSSPRCCLPILLQRLVRCLMAVTPTSRQTAFSSLVACSTCVLMFTLRATARLWPAGDTGVSQYDDLSGNGVDLPRNIQIAISVPISILPITYLNFPPNPCLERSAGLPTGRRLYRSRIRPNLQVHPMQDMLASYLPVIIFFGIALVIAIALTIAPFHRRLQCAGLPKNFPPMSAGSMPLMTHE